MDLFFDRHGLLSRGKGFTFDDVLLVPKSSSINSRKHPKLTAQLTKNYTIEIPLITANMDTITEAEMACKMAELGGAGILHRFMDIDQQKEQLKKISSFIKANNFKTPLVASIGVKEEGMRRADILADIGVQIMTIDIAHGDSVMMLETLEYVKKRYPKIDIIAGNIATPEGVRNLINAGADAVKVGIGPGSMCTTRIITGCGVPQLTAIALCVQAAQEHKVPVIADGGLKNSGDIVKALAAGASTVMIGSLVSGCLETPGEIRGGMKAYRGMASKDAQVSWRGELPKGMAAEGEATLIPCKGSVTDVVNELTGGIRSGMTYLNAESLFDIAHNATFIEMSGSGMHESKPHGVKGRY